MDNNEAKKNAVKSEKVNNDKVKSEKIKSENAKDESIGRGKGRPYTLTGLGYALIIIFLLMVLPVVLPPIFGYHTYMVSTDSTGLISPNGTVVYLYDEDPTQYVEGNIVALDRGDRKVSTDYVDANKDGGLVLRSNGQTSYSWVAGHVRAKTPLVGYLCGMVFHVWGIILAIIFLVVGVFLTIRANRIRKAQKTDELKDEIRKEKIRKEIIKKAQEEQKQDYEKVVMQQIENDTDDIDIL